MHPDFPMEAEHMALLRQKIDQTLAATLASKQVMDAELAELAKHYDPDNQQDYIDMLTGTLLSGSADRRMMNIAQVTLVFDNSAHLLNSESDELEITRRLYRDSSEAEYLINRQNVRLRDIVNIFMDTGLGKDSLSIISQGNVISFAEAKAKDRRGIFEEAAGVAKYKKRKKDIFHLY